MDAMEGSTIVTFTVVGFAEDVDGANVARDAFEQMAKLFKEGKITLVSTALIRFPYCMCGRVQHPPQRIRLLFNTKQKRVSLIRCGRCCTYCVL